MAALLTKAQEAAIDAMRRGAAKAFAEVLSHDSDLAWDAQVAKPPRRKAVR